MVFSASSAFSAVKKVDISQLFIIGVPAGGVRALLAGSDVLLFCHAPEKAMQARDAIEAALASGVLPKQRVEESLEHMRAAKAKYGIL